MIGLSIYKLKERASVGSLFLSFFIGVIFLKTNYNLIFIYIIIKTIIYKQLFEE